MILYVIKDLKKVDSNKIVASFTLVLDGGFEVKGCKLFYSEEKDDYFVFFPSYKLKDKYYSYFSCSFDIRHDIANRVLSMTNKPEIVIS